MKHTRKILVALLVLMSILMSLAVVAIPASAATTAGTTLYLKPNSNWTKDNARFAAYFMNSNKSTTKWVSMTDSDDDGYYEVVIPTGTWKYVIFCRMKPSNTTNDWGNKWNQTADLTIPTDSKNCFTLASGNWDNASTTWSTYTPKCTIHNYNEWGKCTNSGCTAGHTYTIAGSGAHLGTEWDTANAANHMTFDANTKIYTKVYENVAEGSYKLKCAQDDKWDVSYPGSDYAYTVAVTGSKVTVTFNANTNAVNVVVEAPHVHSYSESVTTQPGCESTGVKTFTCSCGDSYTETIDALGHDLVDVAGQAADCLNPGYTAYKDCSRCDHIDGKEIIEALDHDMVIDAAVAPKCEETGLTEGSHCTRCDHKVAQTEVPATGHVNTTTTTVESTCTVAGSVTVICSCGHVVSKETLPLVEHTPGSAVEENRVEATCSAEGSYDSVVYCSVCKTHEISREAKTIEKLPHTEKTVAGKDATCTETGLTEGKVCSVCGVTTVEQTVIPENGHTEKVLAAEDPTCTEFGLTEGKACSVCEDILVAQVVVPSLGHNYVEGECTRCYDRVLVQVGDKFYKTFEEALNEIAKGRNITLYDDVTLSQILVLGGNTVLNGNGHTIHSSAARAINVNSNGTVVIKNLTLTTNSKNARTTLSVAERAINIIQQGVTLTIDKVRAEGFKYTVNVAASAVGSNITINDSIISGYAAINITGNNTTMVVNNSTLTGVNNTVGETNNFAVISIGNGVYGATVENVSITVNGGKLIATSIGNVQSSLQIDNTTGTYAYIDAELELVNGEVLTGDSAKASVFFRADYADELAAKGYVTKVAEDGMISVEEKLPYYIGQDGYWYFNDEKTEHKAVGTNGNQFTIGDDGCWYLNGEKTEYKAVAKDADQYTIGSDGYWYLNNVKTEYKAVGTDGVQYTIGDDGYWYKDGEPTGIKAKADDGKTPTFKIEGENLKASFDGESWFDLGKVVADAPTISENGNWIIGGVETTYPAVGKDGKNYVIGDDGYWYVDGVKTEHKAVAVDGKTPTFKIEEGNLFVTYDGESWTDIGRIVGKDGITPHIGENGNWWIGDTDTGVNAQGSVPYIGENGNWWVGDEDTGVKASGMDGAKDIIIYLIGIAALFLITMFVAFATRKYRGFSRFWILR